MFWHAEHTKNRENKKSDKFNFQKKNLILIQ